MPSVDRRPEVVTFDCYGTLIDWETGIKKTFRNALSKSGSGTVEEGRIFELYLDEERRIEKDLPYRPYREVLSETVREVARRVGWDLSMEQSRFLASDLPNWRPFPDTNPALRRLAKGYTLGILSNVDNDLLAGTLKHLAANFEIIVTAEQVMSYKPGSAHFERARRMIGENRGWLHVASSLYHDIEPARRLGIRCVWVNRGIVATGHGSLGSLVKEVNGLGELADWLET